jgi:hypothetical protein
MEGDLDDIKNLSNPMVDLPAELLENSEYM